MSASAPLATLLVLLAPIPLAPPETRTERVVETLHGVEVVDDYRWLEALEAESEEVRAWTTAQNDRTRAILDRLPCRQPLLSQLEALMSIDSIGTPVMRGDLYFFTERTGTQNQPLLKVRRGHDGEARTLLDVNTLDPTGLTSLDWWEPSPDGRLVAFGTSIAGSEMSELAILETESGRWLADTIPGKASFSAWLPDGSAFVYSALRDPKEPYSREVRFHEVGRSPRQDRVIAAQRDPSRVPFAWASRDGRWLFVGETRGWQANDLAVADFDRWRRTGALDLVPIAANLDGRFTPQGVVGDTLYMLTTLERPNAELVAVDLNDPRREAWRTVLPERSDEILQGVSIARGLLVATRQKDASTRLEIHRLDGASVAQVPLPGIGSASVSVEPDRTEAFVAFTSFNDPRSIRRLDLRTPTEQSVWATTKVPADLSAIAVEQVRARSKDGTEVPMFIVSKRGTPRTDDNPTLIYAYGGFNISLTPAFNPTIVPWLERGGVYVVANLRGGGEFGRSWHRAGMLESKQNVFDDLYACAEWLIAERITSPSRLAVRGGSNGGLLTGVAVVQRPELFSAAISAVPLLDMLRYHRFLIAQFWVPEYGSADDPTQFSWLSAYSPYHHIEAGRSYPAVLFTAGENDSRVHPLHARKMAARMQALAANDDAAKPILLWVDRDAGHGQGKPLAKRIAEEADQWAFLMWQTGMCDNS
jgi:prolyl oligopeptidase